MTTGRYRITNPTLALFEEHGRHVAHTVPTGAIITVDTVACNGDRLVGVTWDERKVMMFVEDLRVRAERVKETSRKYSPSRLSVINNGGRADECL